MKSIDITMNWQSALPMLLMVYQNADTQAGRDEALAQLKWMALLADHLDKQLEIEVFAMTKDTLTPTREEPEYYDVLVRFEGEDPIEEFEGLSEYPETLIHQLQVKYPGALLSEIGG